MCPWNSGDCFGLVAVACLSPRLPAACLQSPVATPAWNPCSYIHLDKRLLQASTGKETEAQTSPALC